ncbi:MAG: hypothetical protein ACREFH_13125 [Stellaceae bacterium]
MAANSKLMIAEAERRYPVRIRLAVPPGGPGVQLDRIKGWLDQNCGADGWAMTPSGSRGVLNDALSIYFRDPALATAFVARWCIGYFTRSGVIPGGYSGRSCDSGNTSGRRA